MGKMPAFQFYPGDWIQDTRFLTNQAKGAWIDMLCAMWRAPERGKLGPMDMSCYAKLIGEDLDCTRAILNELISLQICDTEHNCNGNVTVINRRMVREEKERQSTRYRVKRHRNATVKRPCNADVTVPSSSSSSSSSSKKEKNMVICTAFDDRFWPAYPKKKAKPHALRAWKALKPDEETIEKILADLPRWKDTDQRFIPHPATYLNGRRWEDEDKERNKWADWIKQGELEDANEQE